MVKFAYHQRKQICYSFSMRAVLKKSSQFILILAVSIGWIFSGWPQIFNFPPKVEQARAAAPAGVIVGWPGTEASIPAGWSRVTDFDGFFLKSVPTSSTNPGNATSTATTHTHTSPTHNHTQDAHSHTSNSDSGAPSATSAKHTAGGDNLLSTGAHTHTVPNSSSDTATNQTTVATLSDTSNDPPYREVIWIQSNGTADIPSTAIAFFNSASLPTGWDAVSPGKFLKGAGAASDPGADGGADSHTHTSSHNHTQDAHGHAGAEDPSGTDTPGNDLGTSNPANSAAAHAHSITWATTVATNQAADGNVATASYLPPYYALVGVQNTGDASDLPENIIAVWRGDLASIPANWVLADGTNSTPNLLDQFVMATSTANLGNTGGSPGHSHTASAHSHAQDLHTHALTLEDPSLTAQKRTNNNGGPDGANAAHTHSATSAGEKATNQDATITVDNTSDTRPPFAEVAFIQYQPSANSAPNKPTNSSPANEATDVGVNPTLTGSTYVDGDADPHANTEWQVDNDVNFATPVWTRTAGSGEESTVINTTNGTFANELSGETKLAFNTQYYWQVRYSDGIDWSSWSDATSFTTANLVVSITIDPASFAYGNMDNNTASTTLTLFGGDGITIVNTGTVAVTLDIFGAHTADWTLAGSTGSNQYVHQFCNDTANDCSLPPTDYTALTTSPQEPPFATGVEPSGTTALQLRIITPNPSTVFAPQSAAVTVQATAE
jgi:hypothetical protein